MKSNLVLRTHQSRGRTGPGRGNARLRVIDYYVGIPLIAALGALRKKQPLPPKPDRIGVLNTAAIGDTVIMSAVIADLHEHYRRSQILLLTGPSNDEVSRMIKHVEAVIQLRVFNPLKAIRQIRNLCLDILLDFGPWSRLNALFALCSDARFTVGFRTARQYRHYGYDVSVEHGADVHELENHRRIVSAIGVQPTHLPSLTFDAGPSRTLVEQAKPFVVFHPWPGGTNARFKEWPETRWVALAEELIAAGYRVVLTGSQTQRDLNEQLIARIGSACAPRMLNVAGISLCETAGWLAGAQLVVSVDTGIMHVANSLPVPLVALHGPTSAKRWGPAGIGAISLESPIEGSGYLNLGFEHPPQPPRCMEGITFDCVLQACRTVLEANVQSLLV